MHGFVGPDDGPEETVVSTKNEAAEMRSRVVREDGTSPGEWEAMGFYGSELTTDRPAYTVLTVYGEVARTFSEADARLVAEAVNAYRKGQPDV